MSSFFDLDSLDSTDVYSTENDSASDDDTDVGLFSYASLQTNPDPLAIQEFLKSGAHLRNTDEQGTTEQVTSRPRYQLNPTLTEAKDDTYVPVTPTKSGTSISSPASSSSSKPLSITSSRGNSYSLVSTSTPSQSPSTFPTSDSHGCGVNADNTNADNCTSSIIPNATTTDATTTSTDTTERSTSTSDPFNTNVSVSSAANGSCVGRNSSIQQWIALRTIRQQNETEELQHRTRLAFSIVDRNNANDENDDGHDDANDDDREHVGVNDAKNGDEDDDGDDDDNNTDQRYPNESALNMVRARFLDGDLITDDSISAILELTNNNIESTVEFLAWEWPTRNGNEITFLTTPTTTTRSAHSALSTTHLRQQTSLATALGITSASTTPPPPPMLNLHQSPTLPTQPRLRAPLSGSRTERVHRRTVTVATPRQRQTDQRQPHEDDHHHRPNDHHHDDPHSHQRRRHHHIRHRRRRCLSEPDYQRMAEEENPQYQSPHQRHTGRDHQNDSEFIVTNDSASNNRQRTSLSHTSPHSLTVLRQNSTVDNVSRLTFDNDVSESSSFSSLENLHVQDRNEQHMRHRQRERQRLRSLRLPSARLNVPEAHGIDGVDDEDDHSGVVFVNARVATTPRRRTSSIRTILLETDSDFDSDDYTNIDNNDSDNVHHLPEMFTRPQHSNQQLGRDTIAHPHPFASPPTPTPPSLSLLSPPSRSSAHWQRRWGNVRRKLFRTNRRRRSAISVGDVVGESMFRCPITQEIMQDPVMTVDGHSYDKSAIKSWLQFNATSPLTNAVLPTKTLTPNFALRHAIDDWHRVAKTSFTKIEKLESELSNLKIKNEKLERKHNTKPGVFVKIRNKIKNKNNNPKTKNEG